MNRIDYSRLRSLTARQLVRALRREGFNLDAKPVATSSTIIQMEEG